MTADLDNELSTTSSPGDSGKVSGGRPGLRVGEHVLDELIGRGGFGEVWRAHHHVLKDKLVAVKVPLDPDYVSRLKSEGILQHSLEGEHVVRILGLDPDHDPPYLTMEWVSGQSLRDYLKAHGRLDQAEALRIGREIAEALTEAHRKSIVHRDLKPENILLDQEGRVRLTDFGLGKLVEGTTAGKLLSGSLVSLDGGNVVGTLRYMSPEQRDPQRAATVDARADVYAFGLVLFEMLTGSPPEGVEAPSEVVASLDPRIDAVFRRCYARLESRYAHMGEVLRELDALSAEDAQQQEPAPASPLEATPLAPVLRRSVRQVGLSPTGFWPRLIAAVIDLCLVHFLTTTILRYAPLPVPPPLFLPLTLLLYDALFTGLTGRTPGKWLLGARVISYESNKAISLPHAFARTLLKGFSALPLFLGFALAAIDDEKRTLHDHAAGTLVVYDI